MTLMTSLNYSISLILLVLCTVKYELCIDHDRGIRRLWFWSLTFLQINLDLAFNLPST